MTYLFQANLASGKQVRFYSTSLKDAWMDAKWIGNVVLVKLAEGNMPIDGRW